MLGAGPGDADDIHFLKRVIADQMRRDLSGNDHQRDGIHVGGGNAGYGVGGAGTGSHQADAHFSACPRIAVRGVNRALFVPDQDMPDGCSGQFVINVDDGASGKTEEGVHAFFLKDCHQDLRSGQGVFDGFHK